MQKFKIGIIGLGFVGSAMMQSFTLNGCHIHAAYDKYNKEQAFSWSVMVFNESKQVKLFCPTCYKDVQAWAEDTITEAENE